MPNLRSPCQTSVTTGRIIGRRRVREYRNRDRPSWMDDCHTRPFGVRPQLLDQREGVGPRLVEEVVGGAVLDEPPRDEVGPRDHGPCAPLDGQGHDDHAVLGEQPAIAEHHVAGLVDAEPVDVDVPRRHALVAAADGVPVDLDDGAVVDGRMWSRAMPTDAAMSAWIARCRYSPWTGTKYFGRVSVSISFSSSRLAWPEACTWCFDELKTRAPRRYRLLMVRCTASSLPGIGLALMITVSPSCSCTIGCSPAAMRESADIGSPCAPVHSTESSWSGTDACCLGDTKTSGVRRKPSSWPTLDVVEHRPTDDEALPPAVDRGVDGLLQAGDVGREGGHEDAPGRGGEQRRQPFADVALALRGSLVLGVGRVAEQEEHALVAEPGEPGHVGWRSLHRCLVDLEVAGVDDHARRACGGPASTRPARSG